MSQGVVIPLKELAQHEEAFRWLDRWIASSYSYFARLVIDAFFTEDGKCPSPEELVRAFFNFIQENRIDVSSDRICEVPDVVMEHIDQAAAKALKIVRLVKETAERDFGIIVTDTGYELLPSTGYDLILRFDGIAGSRYPPIK